MILHAGDLVGYNPFPNEVVQLFREKKIESIIGNHDYATLTLDTSWFNPIAAEAIHWTRRALTEDNLKYLLSLKRRLSIEVEGRKLKLIHGSPFNDDEYVYPHEAHKGMLLEADADILILGHTHVPFVRRFKEGLIVNPGSVGQPRDLNWKASYGIYDSRTNEVEIYRIPYDVEKVAKRIYEEGLSPFLAERLKVGR